MKAVIPALFVCIYSCAFTQDFNYRHFTVASGLPSSTVYSIAEDSSGFIWFGTDNGLVRFDGFHYKQFSTADGLPDNEVLHIWCDSKNRIWINCYNSPIVYLQNDHIVNSSNSRLLKYAPKTFVYDKFLESPDGTIWISGLSSTIRINADTLIRLDIPGRDGNPLNNFVESEGKVYLLNATSFYRTDTQPLTIVAENNELDSMFMFNKNEIFNHRIYAFNKSKVALEFKFDLPQSLEFVRKIWFEAGVAAMCRYNDSSYAVGTDNGFVFTDLQFNAIGPYYLKGKNISSMLCDRQGNLWIATIDDGVYFLPVNKCISFDFTGMPENAMVTAISCMNDSLIVAGSEKGNLYIINGNRIMKTLPAIANEFYYHKILDIHPIDDGLFVTAASGFYKINPNNDVKRVPARTIIKTVSWFGNKIFSGTASSGSFIDKDLNPGDTIVNKRIISSAFDKSGTLWLATLDSLYFYDNKLQPVTWYQIEKHSRISSIRFLKNGSMVLATYNNGVLINNNGHLTSITKNNGLAGNLCRDLYIDDDDHILVCTSDGLTEINFDTSTNSITWLRNYFQSDGLLSNSTYSVIVKDETAYVGTLTGISIIPVHHERQFNAIPVLISSYNGHTLNQTDGNNRIEFNHSTNDLHFEYIGISFNTDEPLHYAYRLTGANDQWDTTFENGINYSNLSPGNYTFEVYAFDGRGNKSTNPASVSFVIHAAYWQTVYFRIFVFALLIACIYFIINYRQNQLRKKEIARHEVELQITELKLSAIRAQMNPHFIFNALNSIQHFNIVHDFDSAQKYLSDFSKLVRKTLDFSTKNFISLSDEIDYLDNYLSLEKLRFEDGFNYSIIKSDEVPSEIEIPSQVIQPFAENAILHGIKNLVGKKGFLKIRFYIADKLLFCIIDDNGIGINASKKQNAGRQHESKGLNLSGSRIQAINALYHLNIELTIEDKSDIDPGTQGTTVIIRLPLTIHGK